MEQINIINGQNNFAGEWWKKYNMMPVRTAKLIPILRPGFIFGLILIIGPIWFVIGNKIAIFSREEEVTALILYFLMLIGFLLIVFNIGYLFPHAKLKTRKELEDSDFIENYTNIKDRYVFIARGTSSSHTFGLFDVQLLKVTIKPIYDELKWNEDRTFLTATKDGVTIMVDVNGNRYE